MSNEYIVVLGDSIYGGSSQIGPARQDADKAARANVGTEVFLYQRVTTYKSRVIVEDDMPTHASAEKSR